MTALILFARELASELTRVADEVDAESKTLIGPDNGETLVIALAAVHTLRLVSRCVTVAAKKAFHL